MLSSFTRIVASSAVRPAPAMLRHWPAPRSVGRSGARSVGRSDGRWAVGRLHPATVSRPPPTAHRPPSRARSNGSPTHHRRAGLHHRPSAASHVSQPSPGRRQRSAGRRGEGGGGESQVSSYRAVSHRRGKLGSKHMTVYFDDSK